MIIIQQKSMAEATTSAREAAMAAAALARHLASVVQGGTHAPTLAAPASPGFFLPAVGQIQGQPPSPATVVQAPSPVVVGHTAVVNGDDEGSTSIPDSVAREFSKAAKKHEDNMRKFLRCESQLTRICEYLKVFTDDNSFSQYPKK